MATYRDIFTTASTGNQPANYSNITTGGSETSVEVVSDSSWSQNRAAEALVDTSSDETQAKMERDSVGDIDEQESVITTNVTSDISFAAALTRGSVRFGAEGAYVAYLYVPSNTTSPELHIGVLFDGNPTGYSLDTASLSGSLNSQWKIKLQSSSDTHKAKAWEVGSGEPSSFQAQGSDSFILQGKPGFAFNYYNDDGLNTAQVTATEQVGFNGIGTNGDSAPTSPYPEGTVAITPSVAEANTVPIRYRNNSRFYDSFMDDTLQTEPDPWVVPDTGSGVIEVRKDVFQNLTYQNLVAGYPDSAVRGTAKIVTAVPDNFTEETSVNDVQAQMYPQRFEALAGIIVGQSTDSDGNYQALLASVLAPRVTSTNAKVASTSLELLYLSSSGYGVSPAASAVAKAGRHDQAYNFRVKYTESQDVKMKVWKKGNSEPSWQTQVPLSDITGFESQPGTFGITIADKQSLA